MRFDLRSGTDVAFHALFDPAALPPASLGADPEADAFPEQLREGRIAIYSDASDGEATFRVYVDEEPDATLAARARGRVTGGLLRVPGGTLWATGAEYVLDTAASNPPHAALGASADVPPGNYAVDAFAVEYDEEEVEAEVARHVNPRDRRREDAIGTLTGFAFFGGLVTLALTAIRSIQSYSRGGWPALSDTLSRWGPAAVVLVVTACIGILYLKRSPAAARARAARANAAEQFPDAVVVLRRLSDDVDVTAMTGVRFGPAYADEAAAGRRA